MTTVINNPGESSDNGGAGVIVGVILVILVLVIVAIFAFPYVRQRFVAPATPAGDNVIIQLSNPLTPEPTPTPTPAPAE